MGILRQLRKRNTVLLLSAQLISELGSVMQTFALSLYVYTRTNSDIAFASVLAVSVLPRLIGPFSGVLIDRVNRKRLMIVLDSIAGGLTLGFAVWHQFVEPLPLGCVYAFVVLLSVVQTIYDPTVYAIIPELTDGESLKDTNVLSSITSSSAMILGPVVASMLNPGSNEGIMLIMVINSCSFFVAAVVEAFFKNKSAVETLERVKESVLASIREGVSTIFGSRELIMIVALSIVSNLALYPVFSVGVSIIMFKDVGVSNELFGLSRSILYIGPIAGSILAGSLLKNLDYRKLITRVFLVDGVMLALMAGALVFGRVAGGYRVFAQFIGINLLALCIVATVVIASIAVTTAMQRIVPGRLMGRVSGVDASLSMMAVPAGQMLFSLITGKLGSDIALIAFSAMVLVTSLIAHFQYKPMLQGEKAAAAGSGASAG